MCTLFERAENIQETSCHIRFWGFTSNNPLYASTTKRVPLGPARMPRGLPQVGSSSWVSRKINNRNRRLLQDSTCALFSVQESLPYLPKQTPCCTEQKDHSVRNGPAPAAAHCKKFGMGAYCRCYYSVYLQNEHTIRCLLQKLLHHKGCSRSSARCRRWVPGLCVQWKGETEEVNTECEPGCPRTQRFLKRSPLKR